MYEVKTTINYKERYENVKRINKKKGEKIKGLLLFRDKLLTENIQLKKKIQTLENEVGVSNVINYYLKFKRWRYTNLDGIML